MGYIKNVLGLTELIIPGEESRKQTVARNPAAPGQRPNRISLHPSGAVHIEPAPSDVGAQQAAPQAGTMWESGTAYASSPPANSTGRARFQRITSREPSVTSPELPSVPSITAPRSRRGFEECNAGPTPTAGQAARMTNPAGFANVRAHAEAHLRVVRAGTGN